MMEHYTQTVGLGAHAEAPPRETPSTVAISVLESGHYYQVRIMLGPLESRRDLEPVESMLSKGVELPDCPTPLPPGRPPDPLTAILSGAAGAWHPGHALTIHALLRGPSS